MKKEEEKEEEEEEEGEEKEVGVHHVVQCSDGICSREERQGRYI